MERQGLSINADDVVNASPSRQGGRDGLDRVLRPAARPTGLVCFNDEVAVGAMARMRELGLIPGRDLSLVGFDDVPEARSTFPPLSSVAIEPQSLGRTAGELLVDLVEERSEARQVVVPVTLNVRGTSASPTDR